MAAMTEQTRTLRHAWDDEAAAWIAWARSPEADHAFWFLNLPALLDLLPVPGGLIVDVACGEGRVARALKKRGHHVVGVEGSPALVAAAREADPDFEVHVGDAADLPLDDASADVAVSSLALMNLDDMPGAIREIARVLRPGGLLVFSILHPVNSWGDAGDVSYFATKRYAEDLVHGELQLTVNDTHRPLSGYLAALEQAGFVVEALREPVPSDAHVSAHPHAARWRERPGFLHVRARSERD
jgi:SAM-dependent methyltransferase